MWSRLELEHARNSEWRLRCEQALIRHSRAVAGTDDWLAANGIGLVSAGSDGTHGWECSLCRKQLACVAYCHHHVGCRQHQQRLAWHYDSELLGRTRLEPCERLSLSEIRGVLDARGPASEHGSFPAGLAARESSALPSSGGLYGPAAEDSAPFVPRTAPEPLLIPRSEDLPSKAPASAPSSFFEPVGLVETAPGADRVLVEPAAPPPPPRPKRHPLQPSHPPPGAAPCASTAVAGGSTATDHPRQPSHPLPGAAPCASTAMAGGSTPSASSALSQSSSVRAPPGVWPPPPPPAKRVDAEPVVLSPPTFADNTYQ